jgi:hypothetical protein
MLQPEKEGRHRVQDVPHRTLPTPTCDVPWHGGGLTSRGRKLHFRMQFVAQEKKKEP